jgi:hypothetical protein
MMAMKRTFSLFLLVFLCVLWPWSAQGKDRTWVAEMSVAPDGLVSLMWSTRGGYGYRVETSADLTENSWQALAGFYGNGGMFSIPVAQLAPVGGGSPPVVDPLDSIYSGHYTLRVFPGLNKTLVSWNQPGQNGLSQVLLAEDFSGVLDLPIFFWEIH